MTNKEQFEIYFKDYSRDYVEKGQIYVLTFPKNLPNTKTGYDLWFYIISQKPSKEFLLEYIEKIFRNLPKRIIFSFLKTDLNFAIRVYQRFPEIGTYLLWVKTCRDELNQSSKKALMVRYMFDLSLLSDDESLMRINLNLYKTFIGSISYDDTEDNMFESYYFINYQNKPNNGKGIVPEGEFKLHRENSIGLFG